MFDYSIPANKELMDGFCARLSSFSEDDRRLLTTVAYFADNAHKGQLRKSGEPYIIHPIAVAETLVDIRMDAPTVAAGLLHDVIEDTEFTYGFIKENFSEEIANLVDGVTKIANIEVSSKTEQEAQTIRKMFFAMAKDPRVIIIKLSDKLHNMRTLKFLNPVRAKEIAYECMDVFAPLADRLGINTLKIKLEDESFRVINPEMFRLIEEYIGEQTDSQKNFLEDTERVIRENIASHGIREVQIESRVKHINSIYQKMRRRGRDVTEIQDIYGMRIICSSIVECYTILGVVHSLYVPVEGHFKDYIAMPKANNYQSLHTTVVVNFGKKATRLEIQIRTFEMDAVANFGVASHWAYKAESGRERAVSGWNETDDKERFFKLVNRMKNWKEEIKESDNFMEDITNNLLKDTIVVFTPKGKAVELPLGATALDFAYTIHSDVGNRCQMAKVNGNIIALSQPLKNTDIVEIITSPNACPKENWLRYAFTQSARRKIKAYLNKHDSTIMFAKDLVVKNLDRNDELSRKDRKGVQEQTGRGEKSSEAASGEIKTSVEGRSSTSSLMVGKEKNMMISFAKCCHPVKGDPIIGYVSRGRGVIVHKKDCPNLPNMAEIADRLIFVSWDDNKPSNIYRFRVVSKRTSDLFGEIEQAVRKYGGILLEGRVDDDDGVMLNGTFALELPAGVSVKSVTKAMNSIHSIVHMEIKR